MVRRRKVQSTRCEEGRKKEEKRKKEGRKKEERRKKKEEQKDTYYFLSDARMTSFTRCNACRYCPTAMVPTMIPMIDASRAR